ncbi:MAG: hypothetical protein ACI4ST_04455, partial [Candidatus Gallimonas sp.]
GAEFVDGTHLRVDNWINGIGGQNGSITDQGLTYAATTNVTDWEAMKNAVANGYATVVWDWSSESEIIVTIHVIGLSNGYEFTQLYTVTPLSGNEFESEYSIGLAPDEGSFYGDIVCVGPAGDVDPNPSKKDASGEIVIPTDPAYSNNQNPTAENPIVVGAADNSAPYPGLSPEWIGRIDKGEKVVMSGTHNSAAAVNWQSVFVYLFSGLEPKGLFRMDWWILDAGNAGAGDDMAAAEGWTITKTTGPDWGTFLSTLNGTMTVTFDWSNPNTIVVRFDASDGTNSNTMAYTISQAEGHGFAEYYNIGLACEASGFTVTKVERSTPGVQAPVLSENQTNPVVGAENCSFGFTYLTPAWIGESFTSGQKVTLTGTLKTAGAHGWEVPIAYLMSSASNYSLMRTDGFNGGNNAAEGWTVVSSAGISGADSNYVGEGAAANDADTDFLTAVGAGCSFTLTYDWTDADRIVVTATFTDGADMTRTTTFTITSNGSFASQYWIGLGGENVYLQVSSIVRT